MQESISNKQLVDAYIRYRGMVRIDGDDNDISCLIPLLLLDMHLDIFTHSIRFLECRHETKKARTKWRECYNTFNHGSFLAFKNEYEDKIMKLMDELAAYISNNVMFLKVAVMDVFKDSLSVEKQEIIANIILCNTFAKLALSWWGSVFKKTSSIHRLSYIPEENRYLEGMAKYSEEFCNRYAVEYLNYRGYAILQEHPEVVKASQSLDKKIAEWANLKASETDNSSL